MWISTYRGVTPGGKMVHFLSLDFGEDLHRPLSDWTSTRQHKDSLALSVTVYVLECGIAGTRGLACMRLYRRRQTSFAVAAETSCIYLTVVCGSKSLSR
jgi:hypothetical protein